MGSDRQALKQVARIALAGGPTTPFVPDLATAKAIENGLPNDTYYKYLTTGGTGLKGGTPDTRIPNVENLPALDLEFAVVKDAWKRAGVVPARLVPQVAAMLFEGAT